MSSSSCSTSTTAATIDCGDATAISAVHPDIIQTHILTRLDGPTLASTSCASSHLHGLCTEENLWKTICNSSWPSTAHPCIQQAISSFPFGHRSFYSDSFPTLHHHHHHQQPAARRPKSSDSSLFHSSELISAVDIRYGNELVYSKVAVTETSTGWFMCSPFRVDLLDPKEIVPAPAKFDGEDAKVMAGVEENMRLSWIVIDTGKKRAVNLSSLRPVDVRRHWLTGEIQISYATMMAAGGGSGRAGRDFVICKVVVTCGGKEGGDLQVREISMQVEDMEGKIISGKDALVFLQEAMDGKRRKGEVGEEKRMYEVFLEMRSEWRERKQNRERRLDMLCIATGVSIFMAFWIFVLSR